MILVFWNLMLCCWVNDFRSFLMSGAFIFKSQTIPVWSYSLNCFTFTKKATSFQNSWTTKQLTTDHLLFFLWRCGPTRAMASSFTKFLDHTQRRITVGRTSLDEWSARRRDFYLTAHNTHNRQTSYVTGGIRTHDLSRRSAADLHLRPRGLWDIGLLLEYLNPQKKNNFLSDMPESHAHHERSLFSNRRIEETLRHFAGFKTMSHIDLRLSL